MIKIVLLGNVSDRKQTELALSQYFTEKNISFEFHHATSAVKFLGDYLFNKGFRLFLICSDKKLAYIIKIYDNFDIKTTHMISGTLELPPTPGEIEEKLIKNIELSSVCPYGYYYVNNHTVFRKILHEDIEYIQRENNITVIHLRNGETVSTIKNINKISNELKRKYFVKCGKGCIINLFNVKTVNKDLNTVELKSGIKIPLKKNYFQKIVKAFAFAMNGITLCDD